MYYERIKYIVNYKEKKMIDLKEIQKQVYQNKLNKKFNVADVSMEFALTYGELSEAYEAWWKKKNQMKQVIVICFMYI